MPTFCYGFAVGRRRVTALLLAGITIALGLGSRQIPGLHGVLAKAPGDVLYATMAYWLARFGWPLERTCRLAGGAWIFCCLIEFSQMSKAPWLVAIRETRLGGLVLGHGFHWTDLGYYALGVGLAVAVDMIVLGRPQRPLGQQEPEDPRQQGTKQTEWVDRDSNPGPTG